MDLTLDQWISIGVGAASLLVAGGTFFLAWKTRDMARETKDVAIATATEADKVGRQAEAAERQIELSRRQIELSRAALDATIRPWLTKAIETRDLPQPIAEGIWDERTTVLRMYVRNVGPGIALIESGDEFRIQGLVLSGAEVTRRGFADATALPPGETTRVSFVLQNVELEPFFSRHRNSGEFYVWIPYTDSNGGQPVSARIHATFNRDRGSWLFYQIHYFRPEEEEAFATVEFDAAVP